MRRPNRAAIFKVYAIALPIGFLIGAGITYLPHRPSLDAYLRTHPPSIRERCLWGGAGALLFPPLMVLRLSKNPKNE
jgi:hypothetical protein